MANHGVVVQSKVMAANIDTLNRAGVSADLDLDNGSLVVLATKSTTAGETEVWAATVPATATLSGLWMVYSPEVNIVTVGTKKLKGIPGFNDPRDFVNPATLVFDAFKPQVGDIIQLSSDCIEGTKGTNGYAVAADAKSKLQWGASAVSGLSLKLLGSKDMPIATGAIDTQHQTAYLFEVVAN